jgi:hypothetical protein
MALAGLGIRCPPIRLQIDTKEIERALRSFPDSRNSRCEALPARGMSAVFGLS